MQSPSIPALSDSDSEMIPPGQGQPEEVQEQPEVEVIAEERPQQQGAKKKRIRPSKKDIADYPFTEEQQQEIADFVRDNPALYDKKDRRWSQPKYKEDLWRELAARFPECSHQQVRKFFDAKRTDFGKIEKKEFRSGAAARVRTGREDMVVAMWGFLAGHIAHEQTQSSDQFSPPEQQQ